MRSIADYLRGDLVDSVKNETLEYKKFKKIIELSIQLSKEKIEIAKSLPD